MIGLDSGAISLLLDSHRGRGALFALLAESVDGLLLDRAALIRLGRERGFGLGSLGGLCEAGP
jgi:hypothetical protein